MPHIQRTSNEEEAKMVAMMTAKQAAQAELTFARRVQVSPATYPPPGCY